MCNARTVFLWYGLAYLFDGYTSASTMDLVKSVPFLCLGFNDCEQSKLRESMDTVLGE